MRTKDLWVQVKKPRPVSVTSGTSITVDEVEKQWFASSNKCDLIDLQKLLAKDGELINKRDYFTGYAAIHWAAKCGRTDVIHWLVQKKADINLRTNGGYSPLHIATQHKQEAIVYKLVHDYKVDIHIRDYSGRKAMHYGHSDSAPIAESKKNGLQETGIIRSTPVHRPLSLVRSVSMSQISGMLSEERNTPNEEESYKKKKRRLSLTSSFLNKGKKKLVVKKVSRGNSFTDGTPQLNKSPSLPDLYGNPFELPDKRESLILNGFDANSHLINGYATFINQNKYHRRTSTCPPTDHRRTSMSPSSPNVIDEHKIWGVRSYMSKDIHPGWRASTYV